MKAGLIGALIATALLGFMLMAAPSDRAQGWETVRLAMDAPNAVILERNAQQYALELAQVEAQRTAALAQERTLRLYAVVAGVVTVALCVAGGLLITHRPQRVVVVHKLSDGRRFDDGAVEIMPYVRGQLTQKQEVQ